MIQSDFKNYFGEFIGTFFLLFLGTGSIIINTLAPNSLGNLGIAFVFGFVILILIYAIGHISGAHFNPAVTISFAICNKFDLKQVLPYIASQFLGGLCGSATLKLMFGDLAAKCVTLPTLPNADAYIVSFIAELIMTFCLMFVIMGSAIDSKAQGGFAGLAIGMTVFVGAAVTGPVCGGSFNPVRSLAPAIVAGNYNYIWIYLTAPVIGAVLGALSYNFIRTDSEDLKESNCYCISDNVS